VQVPDLCSNRVICADILPSIFMGVSLFKVSFFPEDIIGQNRLLVTAYLSNHVTNRTAKEQKKNCMQ